MRRIVVGIAVVAVAAELAARITLPAAVVAPESWDAPARDGWCGSVRWQTDADGQRADATARVAAAHANPLVIVGGEFTAAPGLRLEERYPEQLAARARAGGIDAVVALASRQPLALLDEVLTRAPGAAGGPRVIVVELDPAASRGDAARFSVADQLPPLPDPPAGWSR
ncbi:MAG: hypothetical protein FJ293_06310, partial [Planctomycetes bacterium]|nr:hypothetical protein [Planctomycetota bacterium]